MPNRTNSVNILLVILLIIAFITTFFGGFYLKHLLDLENPNNPLPSPLPTNTPNNGVLPAQPNDIFEPTNTTFSPGEFYFDDTIIAITKHDPHITLVATATRSGKDNEYNQTTRVSFFDGKEWKRNIGYSSNINSSVGSDEIINEWNHNIDPSRVLKETVEGALILNNQKVNFNTGNLYNEISMRSLPGYTKFLSKGDGILTIEDRSYPTYFLYTKIYSLNSSEIQFYNKPLGLTTDWLIFFDNESNLYHIDKTNVDSPTQIYKTHQVGVVESHLGTVLKTFDINITRGSENPPSSYSVRLKDPINESIALQVINSINKAPNSDYSWYLSLVKGSVKKQDGSNIQGVGLVEYIKD